MLSRLWYYHVFNIRLASNINISVSLPLCTFFVWTFLNDLARLWAVFKITVQPMHHFPHIPDIATQSSVSVHFSRHSFSWASVPRKSNMRYEDPGFPHFMLSFVGSAFNVWAMINLLVYLIRVEFDPFNLFLVYEKNYLYILNHISKYQALCMLSWCMDVVRHR